MRYCRDNVIMRSVKPLPLIGTPTGVAGGLMEGWRLASGLALLILAMFCKITAAIAYAVLAMRQQASVSACAYFPSVFVSDQ